MTEVLTVLCLGIVIGIIMGWLISYISSYKTIKAQQDLLKDYQESINRHIKSETRLVYINQSIKNYIKEKRNYLKKSAFRLILQEEDTTVPGQYMAFKDIDKNINKFEQSADEVMSKTFN